MICELDAFFFFLVRPSFFPQGDTIEIFEGGGS